MCSLSDVWLNYTQFEREDMGYLWEHIVFNEILSKIPKGKLCYWRDKLKHEVDFIFLKNGNNAPIAIECKSTANNFNVKSISRFRNLHPNGRNYAVAIDVDQSFSKNFDGITVKFVSLPDLIAEIEISDQ